MKRICAIALAAFVFSLKAAMSVSIEDISGRLQSLTSDKPLVLAWTSTGCPMSKLYRPRLNKLAHDYKAKGVRVLLISSSSQDTSSELRELAKSIGIPVIHDADGRLARSFGISRTTEAVVLDKEGKERYRGAVDDQYGFREASPGNVGAFRRQEPQQHYLRDALEAILVGKEVKVKTAKAYGCALYLPDPGKVPASMKLTFHQHIEPLLQQNCLECHRKDGGGPFALETYKQVKGWAKMIAEVVEEKRMPPWNADPKVGSFRNARGLSTAEVQRIIDWVNAGAPQGNPAKAPPRLTWDTDLGLGKPDHVIKLPPFNVPAEGRIPYRYIRVKPDFNENKWVRAAEFVSNTPELVHHTLTFLDRPRWGRREANEPWMPRFNPISVLQGAPRNEYGYWMRRNQKYFRDFMVGQGGGMNGYFLSGIVGDRPLVLPAGQAKFLPADASIMFQLHYQPNGQAKKSTSQLRLWFVDDRAHEVVDTRAVATVVFKIPPREAAYEVKASYRFQRDALLLALQPHMHFRGKSFRYVAELPNGRRETLLHVPRFDFDWQHRYELAEPKWLPRGTLLHAIGIYDNSNANPDNPDPNQTVWFGLQSEEEMFIGFFEAIWNAPKSKKN